METNLLARFLAFYKFPPFFLKFMEMVSSWRLWTTNVFRFFLLSTVDTTQKIFLPFPKKLLQQKKNVKKRKICLPPPICTFQFLFLHSSMSFGYFSQLVCVLDIESVFTRDSFEPAFPFSPPTHPPSQFPQYFERKQAHHRWKLFEQPENRNSNHSRQSRSWWK